MMIDAFMYSAIIFLIVVVYLQFERHQILKTKYDYLEYTKKLVEVRNALYANAHRLRNMIPLEISETNQYTNADNLRWMLDRVMAEIDTFPVDKSGRWIGYVQGILALTGHLSVASERDITREDYHAAYIATGQIPPPSMTRSST